jgi:hypothetical protein
LEVQELQPPGADEATSEGWSGQEERSLLWLGNTRQNLERHLLRQWTVGVWCQPQLR